MQHSRSKSEIRAQAARRLELARERLASLQPGGSPTCTIEVTSAAVIESHASAMQCPHCIGTYRVLEHTRPIPGLRRLDVECRYCATPRALWFRLVTDEPN